MIGSSYLVFLNTLTCVVYASSSEDEWHQALLKRQAPGTPAYDCHLSCGTAITLSRGSDPCTNSTFLDDYNACIGCAGHDNQNIWQYYGGTLTTAGTKCGLSTTPISGGSLSSSETAASATISSSSTGTVASSTVSSVVTTPSSVASTSPAAATSSRAGTANASASATGFVTTGTGSDIRTSLAGALVIFVAAIIAEVV